MGDQIDALAERFRRSYRREPVGVWSAPGRVNLIGDHTDYNEGFVLPIALAQRTWIALAPTTGATSRYTSVQADESMAVEREAEPGAVRGWAAYPAGVAWALRQDGHDVPALNVMIDSTVPVGAGLSSSAALECALALALCDLLSLELDPTDVAMIARRAENEFVGAPTGAMDQVTAMHGRAAHALAIDCRSFDVRPVPLVLPGRGLELVVLDSRTPHALVDSEYGERRRTCQEAASRLGVRALRDLEPAALKAALTRLPDEKMRRRVRHVVSENARVLACTGLLAAGGDPREIGSMMNDSHASLRDDFEVSAPRLDVAVTAAQGAGAAGARMTGGGFGGCVVALAEGSRADAVVAAVTEAYAQRGWERPTRIPATPSAGAARVR
ncbi:MAG: galactokinase [Actinobacteria bacterium]|nr:galactokinase [Actinomycetota bacterium]